MKGSVIQIRWLKVRWLLGSLATILPCAAAAQSIPNSPNPSIIPSPESPPEDPQTILQSADASQTARDMAAIRLIASRDPAVRPVVLDILTNGPTSAKVAVSRALASVGWPNQDFITPLVSLLAGRDPVPAAAAALALGQYTDNPQVLQALRVQAMSDRADIRQPVIHALGAFIQKPAAETLLYILQHDDSDPIREAAGNALIQMTGRSDLDHNSSLWSDWWEKNGSLPDDKFHDTIIAGRAQRSRPKSPPTGRCKTPPMIFSARISGRGSGKAGGNPAVISAILGSGDSGVGGRTGLFERDGNRRAAGHDPANQAFAGRSFGPGQGGGGDSIVGG